MTTLAVLFFFLIFALFVIGKMNIQSDYKKMPGLEI